MRNRMYGGVRGRKTKVGEKLLRFSPTRLISDLIDDLIFILFDDLVFLSYLTSWLYLAKKRGHVEAGSEARLSFFVFLFAYLIFYS